MTPELLHYYTDMISDVKLAKGSLGDGDVCMHCAYNFPAVLLTVGRDRWSELKDTYFILTKNTQVCILLK